MTRKQIVDYVIKSVESISGCKCTLTYHNETDKYDKEYTYNSFEVIGRKRWKFGIWIITTDDKKSYKVYLFGEHMWYIDKFKPSATEISFEPFEVSKNKKSLPVPCIDKDGYSAPDSIWNFGWAIQDIKQSNILSRIKYYWHRSPVFSFLVYDWFYYTIKSPLKEWYYDYGMIVPLTISKFLYKLRFGRKVGVHIYSTREFFSPKWDFQVVYKDEPTIHDIYWKINKKGRKLFLPMWLYKGCVNLVNAEDESDKHRGFYIKRDETL